MDAAVIGLATAAVGVIGTLGGVLITQARSDRQASLEREAQDRRTGLSLESERHRDRDARLFDHRREVLSQVVAVYNTMMTPPYLRDDTMEEDEYAELVQKFWATLTGLDLYFQPDVSEAFKMLYEQMFDLFNVGGPAAHREATVEVLYQRFLAVARRDLGVG
ncbi:MAG TPA: hypothetical protein VF228_14460 [Iamia sp.]